MKKSTRIKLIIVVAGVIGISSYYFLVQKGKTTNRSTVAIHLPEFQEKKEKKTSILEDYDEELTINVAKKEPNGHRS